MSDNDLSANEKIKKCLKSFLTGKKYVDTDKNKAFEYFKQSLKYLNLIEDKKKYNDILKETETECNKFITQTVEQSIERINSLDKNINLFDIIEKGDITQLKSIKSHHLDFFVYDDEGNTPLHKAVKYGDTTFLKACFKLGAPIDVTNKNGYTTLEYACLEKDPNMITFLLMNGANMKKHLFFRDGERRYENKQNYIDIAIIMKLILIFPESHNYNDLEFLINYFKKETLINFDEFNIENLLRSLQTLLNKLNKEHKETYIKIIREEIVYPLKSSIDCPKNKLEIILTSLVPFIDYPFNITMDWYLNLELKYFFIKLLKEHSKINLEEKKIIMDYIWENYIKTNLVPDEFIGNLISQWLSITSLKTK